ncbi:TIGR03915 family putative DNA repair protein [Aquimarina addita]|uniref:TIGR03915 family putative DNA repair protein n=1 Tax=Aquimarina addita TaxID=870485 RepID=A0ABP6UQS8_9FLAO
MNQQHTILKYDGSFDGFLCCVFAVFEQKLLHPIIRKESEIDQELFTTTEIIVTEHLKAQRVWKSFKTKISKRQHTNLFKAFLSEIKGVENTLLKYIQYIFQQHKTTAINYSNKDILTINQVAKMVGREKHRMEAFVRFQLTKDNIYVATVSPDFNVLPLITSHFKDRYADQKWLIFDTKRNYGIYYNLRIVEIITFDSFTTIDADHYNEKEIDFQKLWNVYYQHVNIESRKNTKLHLQHLPKRYWKYLTEKIDI